MITQTQYLSELLTELKNESVKVGEIGKKAELDAAKKIKGTKNNVELLEEIHKLFSQMHTKYYEKMQHLSKYRVDDVNEIARLKAELKIFKEKLDSNIIKSKETLKLAKIDALFIETKSKIDGYLQNKKSDDFMSIDFEAFRNEVNSEIEKFSSHKHVDEFKRFFNSEMTFLIQLQKSNQSESKSLWTQMAQGLKNIRDYIVSFLTNTYHNSMSFFSVKPSQPNDPTLEDDNTLTPSTRS